MEKNGININPTGLVNQGFVLHDGYSWDLKLQNGMKEGVIRVKNKDRTLFA